MSSRSRSRILILEDNPLVLDDLKSVVRELGYDLVQGVSTGSDALRVADEEDIDLALVDIKLPDGLGDTVGEILTGRHEIPVVYVTAFSDDVTISRMRRARAAGLVTKPFTRQEVRGAVELALEEGRLRRELKEREEGYRTLFQLNAAGVLRQTAGGEILDCNQAFAELFGYASPSQLRGSSSEILFLDRRDRESFVQRLQDKGVVRNFEMEMRRRDGSSFWVLDNSMLARESRTGRQVILSTLLDITERKKKEDALAHMAYHDALTGLANRRRLEDFADRAVAMAERREGRMALLFMDLVSFKSVNDQWGHRVGDRLLRMLADRLDANLRQADLGARLGGDEFAVLLTDVEDADAALASARRIRERLEQPLAAPEEDGELQVEVRIAVAIYPEDGGSWDELLRTADRELARIKGLGRGIVSPAARG